MAINYYEKKSNRTLIDYFKAFLSRYFATDIYKMHYLRYNINIVNINENLKEFDLDVQPLSYEMVLQGDSTIFKGEKLALYEKRLKDLAYHGFGVMENGKLIYSTWFSTENLGLPIVSKSIPLLQNEALLEDSYCAPTARGRGLHGKMNLYRIKKIHELGKDRVLAIVLDGNVPAMKVQIKSGFEELGVFYLGRIFGLKFCTLKKQILDQK